MNANCHSLFRRTSVRMAAIALLAPALGLSVSGAAQAATHGASKPLATPVNCPAHTLCTYENANYNNSGANGTQWNFNYNTSPHLVWFYVGSAANDKISSMYNNRAWVTYVNKSCPAGTNSYAFAGGTKPANLASWGWPDGTGMNDSISAIAFGTSTTTQGVLHGQC